ncbi:MAG TPA: DUF4422 domain-containing protein [Clostridia bacterium]|nr:DUF4422 domain-containing protein [Clostridia bacterium]
MKDIKIVVATHKKYHMPNDDMYLPIHVGKYGKKSIGYQGDDTGNNISQKNSFFCELTGIYWAWKNLNNQYIGLVHYRRHFCFRKKLKDKFKNVLKRAEANMLLEKNDVILTKKRNYYIETVYDHYKHTLYVEPLDETRNIIQEKFPSYIKEFDLLKKRRSAHMFNMFIMKKEIFDSYCEWMFDILFELENRVDTIKYDQFHSRFYGRISELLLDVYINTNNISYKECNFIYMEKINRITKIKAFLKAKFIGGKYGKSF